MSRAGLLLILYACRTFTAQAIDIDLSDYQGHNAVLKPWTKEYLTKLQHTNSSTHLENLETKFVPRWNVTLLKNVDTNIQYGFNNIQYGSDNTQYGYNNIQYGNDNIQYGHDNRQHGQHNVQYGMYNTQYGRHNLQHGQNHYQDGENKVQFAELNIQYGTNEIQNGGSDDEEQTPNGNGRKLTKRSITRGHITRGRVTGGSVTGGSVIGGSTTGGSTTGGGGSVIGGSVIGGTVIGGSTTGGGGSVIGGSVTGGSATGGSTTGGEGGGSVIGGSVIGGTVIGGSTTGGGGSVIGGSVTGGSAIGGSTTGGGGGGSVIGGSVIGGSVIGGSTTGGGGSVVGGSVTGGSAIGGSTTGGGGGGGGSVIGGSVIGGSVIGGSTTGGGGNVIGGSVTGGSAIGGSTTGGGGGGSVIGGSVIGGSVIGGSTTGGGGSVIGGSVTGGNAIGGSTTGGGGGGSVIGGDVIGGSVIGGSTTGGGGRVAGGSATRGSVTGGGGSVIGGSVIGRNVYGRNVYGESVTGESVTGRSVYGEPTSNEDWRRPRRGIVTEDIYFSKGLNDSFNDAVYLKVEKNTRTTAEDHLQDVRLITLSSANRLEYNPGDMFTFRPRNCQDDVDDLFRIFNEHGLDIKPMYKLLVKQMHEGMPVPPFLQTPLTLHQIADQYWDLKAYPTQNDFSLLAQVSEDKLEKDKCIELSSPDGREAWLNYSRKTKRTILEVLRDFPKTTSKLTISILFELFSTIKPRSYAIASSNLQSPNSLDLLVDVVEYRTELKMPRKGLGSNWLKGLTEEDGVYGRINKGTFVFPEDVSTPLILISTGTGLAPIRSVIQQRYHLNTLSNDTIHLIYGCRYRNKDFLFKKELEKMAQEGKLSLYYDFSRDQDDEIYVQHNLSGHKSTLWDLIHNKNAHIYISGNAKKMPENVKEALILFMQDVFKYAGMNIEEGKEFMKRMVHDGRLQIEAW